MPLTPVVCAFLCALLATKLVHVHNPAAIFETDVHKVNYRSIIPIEIKIPFGCPIQGVPIRADCTSSTTYFQRQ